MLSAHHRLVRRQLWLLCTRLMSLHGALIAILEQIDLFGHELDVIDQEHLYDRIGRLHDTWTDLVTSPAWQAIDEADEALDD